MAEVLPMDDAVKDYVARFRAVGLDGGPATDREIAYVEQSSRLPLPASYKAYLLIAGRHPPKWWVGSDCTLGYLPQLRAWADELLRENGQPPLKLRSSS